MKGGDPYGYTGEWYVGYTGLLHLRARWLMPETGTFLSRDPVESEPPYAYVRGNVVNWTDSSGLCAEFGDDACWGVYEQIIQLCPECATMTRTTLTGNRKLHEETTQYLRGVLDSVQTGWRPYDPNDPLTPEQWKISKREAQRFRLPVELVAGTVAVEIVFDTDIFDKAGDLALLILLQRHFMGDCVSTSLLDAWEENRKGPTGGIIGPGAGVGGVHTATAIEVENYYAENGLGEYLPPPPDRYWRMLTLSADEGNIRYIAAYLKQLADIRKETSAAVQGPTSAIMTSHLTALDDIDMQIIYGAYRSGIEQGYGGIEEYQRWSIPGARGREIREYLPFYRRKALRE